MWGGGGCGCECECVCVGVGVSVSVCVWVCVCRCVYGPLCFQFSPGLPESTCTALLEAMNSCAKADASTGSDNAVALMLYTQAASKFGYIVCAVNSHLRGVL